MSRPDTRYQIPDTKPTSERPSNVGRPSLQAAYTLIEVLIASAIFVGVLVIATGTFSTANRIRETATSQQQTTDTARYISETLARDIRAATGMKEHGTFSFYPYDFLESGMAKTAQDASDGLIHATSLRTNRFDATLGTSGGVVTRTYRFVPTTNGLGDLTVIISQTVNQTTTTVTPATSLLPTGIKLKALTFQGLSHQITDLQSQPFVQYQFTIVNTVTKAEQTIRSAVASRELL